MNQEGINKLSIRARARLSGVLILTAYLMLAAEATDSGFFTFAVDAISGLSVIGIAVLLFPLLKPANKAISLGYLSARAIEGILMILAGTAFLFGSTDVRGAIYDSVQVYAFIVGAALLYYLLYKTRLVPHFIAVWGFVAVGFLALVTILGLFDVSNQFLDITLILMITNEIFLAIWLMTKGLNSKVVA